LHIFLPFEDVNVGRKMRPYENHDSKKAAKAGSAKLKRSLATFIAPPIRAIRNQEHEIRLFLANKKTLEVRLRFLKLLRFLMLK
jgi:hypothetical protein